MNNSLYKLVHTGIDIETPKVLIRNIVLTNAISIISFILSFFATITISYIIKDAITNRHFYLVPMTYFLFSLTPILLNKFKKYTLSGLFIVVSSEIFFTILSFLYGSKSIFHLFLLLVPVVTFFIFPRNKKRIMLYTVTFVCLYVPVANHYFSTYPPLVEINDKYSMYIQYTALTFLALGLSVTSYYIYTIINRAEERIDFEKKKSEDLLHNILPQEIAERIKSGETLIADNIPDASVLFSDIVGFTGLSAKLAPKELVTLLNKLFSKIDDLIDESGLEKIKTIGDAYMIASGVPKFREDHAKVLIHFGIKMLSLVKDFNLTSEYPLNIRIGIHSGPINAGIIGKRKFVYDIWGDTVNIASRMESHGVPGEIHISESTYSLTKEYFSFIDRGEIDVKGKGKMRTFLLKVG